MIVMASLIDGITLGIEFPSLSGEEGIYCILSLFIVRFVFVRGDLVEEENE